MVALHGPVDLVKLQAQQMFAVRLKAVKHAAHPLSRLPVSLSRLPVYRVENKLGIAENGVERCPKELARLVHVGIVLRERRWRVRYAGAESSPLPLIAARRVAESVAAHAIEVDA